MIRSDAKALEARIMARVEKFLPDSRKKREILFRIGTVLQKRMFNNATIKRIIDRGHLRKSLKYEIDGDTVSAGSFGVPYAKYHEYGANLGAAGLRGMFAAFKRRGEATGNKPRDKNVIVNGFLKARPFVAPALQSELSKIRRILAEYGAL